MHAERHKNYSQVIATIIYLSVLGHKIANTNHHNNNQIKRKEPLKLNCYKNDTNKSNNHRQSQILAGGEKLKRVYPGSIPTTPYVVYQYQYTQQTSGPKVPEMWTVSIN